MTRFPGNRILALSWSEDRPETIERFAALTDGWSIDEAAGALLASERADCFASTGEAAVALGAKLLANRARATAMDAATVLTRRDFPALVRELASPLQLAWRQGASINVATDAFGIGQIFTIERDGMAAFSTSATLLAELFDVPLDHGALTAFALFGAFPEDESAFEGVRKLPAGATAELVDGRCRMHTAPTQASAGGSVDDSFVAAVRAMHDAFPDADLELSGGLDSRLILAALPRDQRRGHRAVTIGVPGSGDVEVARRIAAAEGLRHELIDISGMAALDADALDTLLADAVTAYDHAANPIDKAALAYAGRFVDSPARFGGQNGEILRGFFYPAQPLDAVPDEALALRLVRWRLEANDRVDPALFAVEPYAANKLAAEDRMVRRLLSFTGNWGERLDQFYLFERMQRWVGAGARNRFVDRTSLYPFFDPDFVAAAMAVPAATKNNSHAAYALLARLDPALAAVPLDNGRAPAAFVGSPFRARFADARQTAKKVAERVRRKLGGGGKPTLGSESIAQLWHRHRLFERLPIDALAGTGLFDIAALDRLHNGSWLPDRPTLGFVLMMSGLVRRGQ